MAVFGGYTDVTVCDMAVFGGYADTCLPSENPSCKDEAEFDVCNLHLFCDDPYAQVVCRKTCEFCDPGQ